MASPFPGMDPYLEEAAYWRGLHLSLIAFATAALNTTLPEKYIAQAESRLFIVQPQERIYPDVALLSGVESPLLSPGRTAVANTADAPEIAVAYPQEIVERFIEIRTVGKPWRVITTIEFLSPTNKTPGIGRQEYRAKQQSILQSPVHLLEIDLLRQGAHTVAVPLEEVQLAGAYDYLVSLHRGDVPFQYAFWRNSVQEKLPRVAVPLETDEPDAVLDLQAIFTQAYDAGRYHLAIDYRTEPLTPLTGENAVWADALLREKGLRS